MFTSYGARKFLRPLLASCAGCPFCHGRIAVVKAVHSLQETKQKRRIFKIYKPAKKNLSLQEIKQKRPILNICKPPKKNLKSVKKENVEPKVYMKDTIRNITNILRYSTWDCAKEQLEKLTIKWDSYTINQVLKSHPPMEKAWLFFNWASRLRGFKHDQFTYTTMLDIFGEARRISSMNHVFQQMQEKGIKIDAVTYTSIMHWLSNDGDVDGAVKMWEEMKAKGCSPTVVSYTAYMKILFNHNRVKEATEVYKEMIRAGWVPNCYTYTVLMEHLAISGKFNEVLEIFSRMQEAGVQPDKATCNILIERCCKARETRALTKVLEYMRDNSLVLRYAVFLEAYETFRNVGECELLLRIVHPHLSFGIDKEETYDLDPTDAEPHFVDQEIVLDFLTRKNFVAVDHLLAEMMKKNIRLHSETISTIVEIYGKHCRYDGAVLAFEYGVKMGLTLTKTAYLSLIGIIIRTNSFPKVVEIVEEMIKFRISVGTYLGALLIYKLGCARKPVPAVKIFDLLPDDQKSTATYTALLGAYFSSGNTGKGLKLFETMRRKGIATSVGTYNVLLSGLERSGRVHELEYYRKERKSLQAAAPFQLRVSAEEMICNLLFARDMFEMI